MKNVFDDVIIFIFSLYCGKNEYFLKIMACLENTKKKKIQHHKSMIVTMIISDFDKSIHITII